MHTSRMLVAPSWKEAIASSLDAHVPDARGAFLELDFAVAPAVGYREGADLDNLCEPVFNVLANRLGWFGGKRPSIRSFQARKTLATPTGCRIRVSDERWNDAWFRGEILLDGESDIPLPRSARDEPFARWISTAMSIRGTPAAAFAVELSFGGPVNLGDVATGRLKNVVDCLYPVIGGRPGAPDDSRVRVLEATKMDPAVGGVRIRVVEMAG